MSALAYLPTPPTEGVTPTASSATVYLPTPFHPRAEEYARTRFAKLIRVGEDGMDEDSCLAACDGILLRVGNIRRAELEKAPKLRMIARNGVGVDGIDLDVCKKLGVVVTNNPGGNSAAVAELCLTLMLTLLRRVLEIDHRIRKGEILGSISALAPGLFNKTIGLIGMGDIAYETAKLLEPFHCTLLIYSPTSPATRWKVPEERYPQIILHRRCETLEEILGKSDVVSLHCPLTESTRNLIGEREMRMMKPKAIIVNTSRGGIVDEKALAGVLKEGIIGGAGLDVFQVEPPHGETLGELRDMLNVVCLPHLGGGTDDSTFQGCVKAIDILADYLDGKGIVNRVV